MSLEASLPAFLRVPGTAITSLGAGPSGAGVYRVESAGRTFFLKISGDAEPIESWRRKRRIQRLAADAGLAPRVIHIDENRRAVLSDFVTDRSFPAFYHNPDTREAALTLLGETLRRVHALPLPADSYAKHPSEHLDELWAGLGSGDGLPTFVGVAVRRALEVDEPVREREPVLSHNDLNPGNIVYDGERILLVDWEVAGPNDPFYDLAAVALFLRMDGEDSEGLLSAYEGRPVRNLEARFTWSRRLVAALCGVMFLTTARWNGFTGPLDETIDSAPSLLECYQRLRAGTLDLGGGEGQWWFGLALIKEGFQVVLLPEPGAG